MILLSVALVMVDSVASLHVQYGPELYIAEWIFTVIFTVEFFVRLAVIREPLKYLFSFFGFVDMLAIIPTYLSFFFPGAQSLLVIRVFRLLRIFRVFKLGHYLDEADVLRDALERSRRKIIVFILTVVTIATTVGTIMYVVEGGTNGFFNIPQSVYWAIVTMTTVGYGDITPMTATGQFLASCLMILGYGILAVPTGIVTTELVKAHGRQSSQSCPNCSLQGHDFDALFCKHCGSKI